MSAPEEPKEASSPGSSVWVMRVDVACTNEELDKRLSRCSIPDIEKAIAEPFNHDNPLHANRYNVSIASAVHPSELDVQEVESALIQCLEGVQAKVISKLSDDLD